MATVTIYTSTNCSYCKRAKALLDNKGIPYSEIRIDLEPARMQEMIERSGKRSVPQIFINEQAIGGFDDMWALEQSGKLDGLLSQ